MEKAAAAAGNTKNNGSADQAMYMECRRNYTAAFGGYVVDGCSKFVRLAGQDQTKLETIVCAKCGCHRSFHRKVVLPAPVLPNSPEYLRDDVPTCTCHNNHNNNNVNMKQQHQYCFIRPVTVTESGHEHPQPPTTWMMRTVTPPAPAAAPNHVHEPTEEGNGSCKSPTEDAEETSQSDDGEEVNKP